MPTGMGGLGLGMHSHSTQTLQHYGNTHPLSYSHLNCLCVCPCGTCVQCILTTMGLPCRCGRCVGGTVLYNTVYLTGSSPLLLSLILFKLSSLLERQLHAQSLTRSYHLFFSASSFSLVLSFSHFLSHTNTYTLHHS